VQTGIFYDLQKSIQLAWQSSNRLKKLPLP